MAAVLADRPGGDIGRRHDLYCEEDMMKDSIGVMRRLWRARPPRTRAIAAIVVTTGLALLAVAAYASSPSTGLRGGAKARESAYARRATAHKSPPVSGHETARQAAQDYRQLLRWAECMRHRGYPRMPDPRRGSPQPDGRGGTALGWGAAYIRLPVAYDAYSRRFQDVAKRCGIDPVTGRPHH